MQANQTVVWAARGAAGLTLLLVAGAAAMVGRNEGWENSIVAALFMFPVWLPTLAAVVRLRGADLRSGAKTAMGAASINFLLTLLVGATSWSEWGWGPRAALATFGLAQVVLGVDGVLILRALPEPAPPPPPLVEADPSWIKRVQALALVSLAATLGPIAAFSLAKAAAGQPAVLVIVPFSVPVWGPSALTWWQMRGRKPKEGLAMTIGLSPLVLLIVAVIGAGVAGSNDAPWVAWYLGAFALTQLGLVAAAVRTYYTMPREAGDWGLLGKWVAGFGVIGFVVLILAGITIPGTMRSRLAANESSAVGSLRTIVAAAVTYSNDYGHGFPPALAVLGPSEAGQKPNCRAADLVDAALVSGTKSGYRIEYRAQASAASAAPGCPTGAVSFVAVARPLSLNRTGIRSFFVDESGVIRTTSEDREATATDPPVQ